MKSDPRPTVTQPAFYGKVAWIMTPLTAGIIALILLFAGLLLALQNDRVVKGEKLRQVTVQAQILARSISAPLAFNDDAALNEYMNALRANPEIMAAGAYDPDGRFVAGFTLPGTQLPKPARLIPPAMGESDLTVTMPVVQGSTVLGLVYVRAALESGPKRAIRYLGIAAIVTMACLVIAVLGASYASLRNAHQKLRAEIEGREKAEEALRQSQKLEAMGQLTGGVAHDFNNLLMIATGGLDLLERTTDPLKIEKLKAGIRQAMDRGAKLTQQLLTFARRSPLRPEVIDVGDRLKGMDTLLDRSLGEAVSVEIQLPTNLWPIEVDPSQFEVAVLNIVLNARDAMPKGGTIIINGQNVSAQDGQELVKLAIVDSGTGIAPDMISKIFEPFFTTKGVGQGTGLGLSQVYGFAKASKGDVIIDSELGRGTTIALLIPRSLLAAPSKNGVTREALKAGDNRRILLVEDDDTVAAMVGEMLGELGYATERVISADAALARLNKGCDFELLLSDMVMPGQTNGIDLVRHAAKRWPELPAVLMTGYSAAAASAASEGFPLLVKPYSIQDLSLQMEAALGPR